MSVNPPGVLSAPPGAFVADVDPALVARPVVFDPRAAGDRAALERLTSSGRVWAATDTLAQQLRDLARSRAPGAVLGAADLEARVAALRDGVPLAEYGR